MRIVYLHQYFNTTEMSGGTRSFEMAKRLIARGHSVSIVTTWRQPTREKSWFVTQQDGIEVHWLPVQYSNHMSFAARIRAFGEFAFWAASRASTTMPDIVFATSTPLTIAIPAVRVAKMAKIPLVFEVRDLWPDLPIAVGALRNPVAIYLARRLEKYAYRNSRHIIALSPGMRDGIVKCGIQKEKITVIPNSCDNELFDESNKISLSDIFPSLPDLSQKKIVAYCGTLGQINGVSYLVDVANHMSGLRDDVAFLIVGDGQEHRKISDYAKGKAVLGKNLFMLSPISKNLVPSFLKSVDIATCLFVDLKEMWANSANKFFDSLAAGIPIAINYGGWHANLIETNRLGLTLPANSPEEAAIRLSKFLYDEDSIAHAKKQCKVLARESFDRGVLATKLAEVLENAVESS